MVGGGATMTRPLAFGTLVVDDQAILDVQDAVGERERAVVVGHGQHGAALVLRDLGEKRHHGLAVLAVEGGGRLVGQKQRRLAGQRAGNRDALLLAARHVARDRI